MEIKVASSVKTLTVNGQDYWINFGDPALLEKLEEWGEREEDLKFPEDGKVTQARYDTLLEYVTDLIGKEQTKQMFPAPNVFLLIPVVLEISKLVQEWAAETPSSFESYLPDEE